MSDDPNNDFGRWVNPNCRGGSKPPDMTPDGEGGYYRKNTAGGAIAAVPFAVLVVVAVTVAASSDDASAYGAALMLVLVCAFFGAYLFFLFRDADKYDNGL